MLTFSTGCLALGSLLNEISKLVVVSTEVGNITAGVIGTGVLFLDFYGLNTLVCVKEEFSARVFNYALFANYSEGRFKGVR